MIVFLVKIVDLRNINIIKKFGGTVDYTHTVESLVFDKKVNHAAGKVWSLIRR